MTGTFDIYQDNAGKYRWRLTSTNGQIVAFTEETYETKAAAISATKSAKRTASGASLTAQTT